MKEKVKISVTEAYKNISSYYNNVLSNADSIDSIIRCYLESTSEKAYFEQLRMRYLSMYLFKTGKTYRRHSECEIIDRIQDILKAQKRTKQEYSLGEHDQKSNNKQLASAEYDNETKLSEEDKIHESLDELQKFTEEDNTTIHRNNMDEFRDKIENIFNEVKEDSSLITIFANYIDVAPKEIFLSKDHCILFEYNIIEQYPIGKKILWSSDSDIEYTSKKILSKDSEDSINLDVKNYIQNYFLKLVKLIKEKVSLENQAEEIFLTLRFVQYVAIIYCAEMFNKLHGEYFYNIESLSFPECVEIFYCEKEIKSKGQVYHNNFTYYLMANEKFEDNSNFLKCRMFLKLYIMSNEEQLKFRGWEKRLSKEISTEIHKYTLTDIDLMSGNEFETFVSKLFKKMGYLTRITQQSFDQGIDIIVERDGVKIGIQAKRYSNAVSNSAIQEVVAGLRHYGCTRGIVVTNSYFSKSARELAGSNDIKLWDRKMLDEKIKEYF